MKLVYMTVIAVSISFNQFNKSSVNIVWKNIFSYVKLNRKFHFVFLKIYSFIQIKADVSKRHEHEHLWDSFVF